MNTDDMNEVTRLLPPPAAPDIPAGRSRIMREHLITETRRARDRRALFPVLPFSQHPVRGRRGLWTGIASACAAGAAAAVAFAILPGGSPSGTSLTGPGKTAAVPNTPAARLLAKVATAAERQPPQQPGKYMYIRSEVALLGTKASAKPHEQQIWLPADTHCDKGLIIEDGQRTVLTAQKGGPACRGSIGDPTYPFLRKLPTDPKTLLNYIYAQAKNEVYAQAKGEGVAGDLNYEAFQAIGNTIGEMIVPPKTAAALFRAAALIPGVTMDKHAVTASGAAGVGISYGDSEWIFNPVTFQFIGYQELGSGQKALSIIPVPFMIEFQELGDGQKAVSSIVAKGFVQKIGDVPPSGH
ncbi:MAG: CU044_5270 family protein [Nocardiopsaceae bacterium]|nr:CU044_5270 family protein [Nocardiopsaceae bacterium]